MLLYYNFIIYLLSNLNFNVNEMDILVYDK
jgi:hypothetical protein